MTYTPYTFNDKIITLLTNFLQQLFFLFLTFFCTFSRPCEPSKKSWAKEKIIVFPAFSSGLFRDSAILFIGSTPSTIYNQITQTSQLLSIISLRVFETSPTVPVILVSLYITVSTKRINDKFSRESAK